MDSLTLTHYTLEVEGRYLVADTPGPLEEAMRYAPWSGGELKLHSHTYTVGTEVEVDSYGAWRSGRVTAIKRSQVEVTYARNQKGLLHIKRFPGYRVRPLVRP